MSIENCEYCTKKDTCKKSIGFMFGGCSIDYEAADALTENGETCERMDN